MLDEMLRTKAQYEDATFKEWHVPGKTHLPEHPEHLFILKYARERVFSTRGLPTWMHDKFDENHILFDILHGCLCSVGAMVGAINGMWVRNKDLFLKTPRDSYSTLYYLSRLKASWLSKNPYWTNLVHTHLS